ncbi:MAG: helix-turn-helix transcriptional regulator [Phenylobacterium sp.]|nr:helix-turn-helix transcriptional regulator [Phenylobacterium sp.]
MELESFRKSQGMSQAQLARLLGLNSKGYISCIERRVQRCPLHLALKIERISGGLVTAASLSPEAAELGASASEAQ